MFQLSPIALAFTLFASTSIAQQYPLPATYDSILRSPVDPNIIISYKQPDPKTCATTANTQKQYSGYISLPTSTLNSHQQDNYIHTFFWFFESRQNPESAPLTIWLQGGPGTSSMVCLFQKLGPCEIVQLPNSSYSTQSRLWGWDRSSNLLFIDQPSQTGFSYDQHVNASVDFDRDFPFSLGDLIMQQDVPANAPAWRVKNGTFASDQTDNTQNSTMIAAEATWHFLQGFLSAFPQYNPGTRPNSAAINPAGVNLFTESYGGFYGPSFANFFEDQNNKRENDSNSAGVLDIRIESLGIINSLVDLLTQTIAIANFTKHNSYGIEAIDLHTYQQPMSIIESSEYGCRALVKQCRDRATGLERSRRDDETARACQGALRACEYATSRILEQSNKSPYDIRFEREVGPGAAYQEYLNYDDVMNSIGAQVNFTQTNSAVREAFMRTGDPVRGTQLSELAKLLARGVRVALIYGDADIICNWVEGQDASLELARLAPSYNDAFPAASYADVIVNQTYVGGQVRQYGNLSFSRIYDAGHLVPYYQPETTFTVFARIIRGEDIGTGRKVDLSTFGTQGSTDSLHSNQAPDELASSCWIRDVLGTCTDEQMDAIHRGQGLVENGIWNRGLEGNNDSPRTESQHGTVVVRTKTSYSRQTSGHTKRPMPTPSPNSGASRNLQFRLIEQPFPRPIYANSRKTASDIVLLILLPFLILGLIATSLLACFLWRRHHQIHNLPGDAEKVPAAGPPEASPVAAQPTEGTQDPSRLAEDPAAPTAPGSRTASVAAQPPTRAATVAPSEPAPSGEPTDPPATSAPEAPVNEPASRKPSTATRVQSISENKTADAEKVAETAPPSRAPTVPIVLQK